MTAKIAISGDLGSGKSTVGRLIADDLKFEFLSTGDLHRTIAKTNNVTTLELNRIAETDTSIDDAVDQSLRDLAATDRQVVIDSRMAWWFIPDALSVHLTVRPEIAARRVVVRKDASIEAYENTQEAFEKLLERAGSERIRFSNLYGVDSTRLRNYDLVIDTSYLPPAEVATIIKLYQAEKIARNWQPIIYVSPRVLFPSQEVREFNPNYDENKSDALPILLGYRYPDFFIYDGHHRVSNSIQRNDDFIVAGLAGEADEPLVGGIPTPQYFDDSVTLKRVNDWNDLHATELAIRR